MDDASFLLFVEAAEELPSLVLPQVVGEVKLLQGGYLEVLISVVEGVRGLWVAYLPVVARVPSFAEKVLEVKY